MSERRDPASYRDLDELMGRLQGIVGSVRDKDTTIEESLDLLEEGIALGLRATDLVDKPDFTEREREEMAAADRTALAEAKADEIAEVVEEAAAVEAAEGLAGAGGAAGAAADGPASDR